MSHTFHNQTAKVRNYRQTENIYNPKEIRRMFIYIKTKKAATGSKSDCSSLFILFFLSREGYPPKLSYMMLDDSTPKLSSMLTTAFDIGPGPHM